MEASPLVSVIIPTYNSSSTIIQAIESVFKGSYKAFEVVVVDDGSTDGTKNLLDPYVRDSKITYVYQSNQGCGAARNAGVERSHGEYLAFLDADDYWHEEKLKMQINVFLAHPEVGVCSTESYIVDVYSDLIWETKRDTMTAPRSGNVARYFAFHNIVTLSSAVVRRDLFTRVHGFETRYDLMMFADLDFWLKLAPLTQFYAITTPLTFYRHGRRITQGQIKENHRRIRDVFRNRVPGAPFPAKFWYAVGWLRESFLYRIQSMKIVDTLKKIGPKAAVREALRRAYLRMDFLAYPYLLYRLKHGTFDTNDQITDFSYRGSLKLLIPGQIESEIREFLDVARGIHPKNILEIGTAHGGNLFLLAKIGTKEGKILSLDLPNGDYGGGYFARKRVVYNKFATGGQSMSLLRDDSHAPRSLAKVKEVLGSEKIDILFIDGDHSYEGVRADFEMYRGLVRKGGIIAFHDIVSNPAPGYGVHQFWNEIKDTYQHREIVADRNQVGYGIGVLFM